MGRRIHHDDDLVCAIDRLSENLGKYGALIAEALIHSQPGGDPEALKALTEKLKASTDKLSEAVDANAVATDKQT